MVREESPDKVTVAPVSHEPLIVKAVFVSAFKEIGDVTTGVLGTFKVGLGLEVDGTFSAAFLEQLENKNMTKNRCTYRLSLAISKYNSRFLNKIKR